MTEESHQELYREQLKKLLSKKEKLHSQLQALEEQEQSVRRLIILRKLICPDCKGSKVAEKKLQTGPNTFSNYDAPCSRCGSTGYLEEKL